VGVSVVTVGPGDVVLPGDKPEGTGGVVPVPVFTVKYKIGAVELEPEEFDADTVQK